MRLPILLLLFTLIIVPLSSFYFGTALTLSQFALLNESCYILLGIIISCFVVGELTKNNSQVDKIWSIAPIIYTGYIALNNLDNPRLLLMSGLVSLWGIRLSYNFARKGGYSWKFWAGEEDYRWSYLRGLKEFQHPLVWSLFNLFFISIYQNILIYLFSMPILAAQAVNKGLTWADYTLAVLFILLVLIELIADQQQWNFQTEKHRRINLDLHLNEYNNGIVRTGLWSIVRHPNYSAEQAIWICFYLFSVVATGEWINWSIAGCILLIILFDNSTNFSESISASKYPAYKIYQKQVPKLIPFTKKKAAD